MTDAFRVEIQEKFSDMAVRPLRCLALATKVEGPSVWLLYLSLCVYTFICLVPSRYTVCMFYSPRPRICLSVFLSYIHILIRVLRFKGYVFTPYSTVVVCRLSVVGWLLSALWRGLLHHCYIYFFLINSHWIIATTRRETHPIYLLVPI